MVAVKIARRDDCLHRLIEAQAACTPERPALAFEDERLSYGELDRHANQLAHRLARMGLGPDMLVALCVPRSIDMVVGMLGILKAGAAYLPIDPAVAGDRIAFMLEDSRAAALLTHAELLDQLPAGPAQSLALDLIHWAGEPDAPKVGVGAGNLAYVVYTSDPAGPKGVCVEHRNIVAYVRDICERLRFEPGMNHASVSTIVADLGNAAIFPALASGGCVHVISQERSGNQGMLAEYFRRERIDVLKIAPSHLAALQGARNPEHVMPAQRLILGGEAPRLDWVARLRRLAPQCEIHSHYGPAETTVGVATCCVGAELPATASGRLALGLPLPQARLHVLDENDVPVPDGEIGELHIGGAGVARGYLNRPELTAEKFIADPFARDSAAKLFRSGDLARRLHDGSFEFCGRLDDEVRRHWRRIEFGEIESAPRELHGVRDAVALAREDSAGTNQPAACIEPPASTLVVTPGTLRPNLASRLPAHMTPTGMTLLDGAPLTANGTIDRHALPLAEPGEAAHGAGHVEPHTEAEEVLAAIWRDLLKIDDVGVHDDFFDLGGRSLLAIQTVSRVRDLFGVDMPAHVLFENPTIAKMTRVVAEARAAGSEVRRIERRRQDGACPLSFAQEQIWFLQQLAPESPAWNTVDVVDLPGIYAPAALDQAMREVMQRHEVLRAAFSTAGGRPAQTILPALVPALREVDLSGLPEAQARQQWLAIVKQEGRRLFDLGRPPLLRGIVVHFSPTEHRLLLCIHQIVADQWSMEVIQRELSQLYEAFGRGRVSPLPELPIRYFDFAHWQREQMQTDAQRRQIDWWTRELDGAPRTLELPADKRRPPVNSFAGACEVFRLPARLRDRARELGMQERATLFMVLEASFAALLQRYTGQDDILVGTPISGRTWTETEGLVGAFLNTVVLRSRFGARMSFREMIRQTRAQALGAYAHADLPFERLVAAIALQRDPARAPLFQAVFALHDPGGRSRAAQVGGALELETGTSRFDLSLFVSESADGLDCLFEYSTDIFEAATVRRMARHFSNLLEAAVAEPDAGLSHLAMLDADELRDLIDTRNATAARFPQLCVHELIEEQAWRTPERIAATFGGESLTYDALDRRATALAQRLHGAGLRSGGLVGLMVERSLDMLVAAIGILKAGAAYVPLDPRYPADRLAYMVEDSGMEMLVTHRALDTRLPRAPRIVVRLDNAPNAVEPGGDLAQGVTPESLAYVLYTSGSMGKPKGVAISHAALANFLLSMQREPGISEDDRLLAVTTLLFDIAGLELFLPLICGATVAIASREEVLDPSRLRERMLETDCTIMQATPTTWRALLRAGWSGSPKLKALCGGEAMPADVARALLPRCRELWNMYGPTETTVWSTLCRIDPADVAADAIPIGRPIANTQVFVLDAGRNPLPAGLLGELYIGGRGLARGYWGCDDLTRQQFVRSPFAADALIYRTGDLARWLPDGRLLCAGRIDKQLKVRGFRIEAGEVETAMLAHSAVREAVAATRDVDGEARLVGYFVAAEDAPDDMEDRLRALLRTRLPDYMVPSWFVALPALPCTPNGKLDRNALPAPAEAARSRPAAMPPRTATEAKALTLFREVLGRSDFGIFDNFFDFGGHSLMAAQLMAKLREAFAIAMPLRNLFQQPTVAALSETIEELSWLSSGQAEVEDTADREEMEL